MVGIFGAGMTHLRLADGRHLVIDNYTTAPAAARPDMYRPVSDTWPDYLRAEGDVNLVGLLSVGVPGTLKAWSEAVARFGRLDLETVMQPAIRHAERGFRATPYLVEAVRETAPDLARFPETARTFLPGGAPIKPGDLIAMPEYAATLRLIAAKGPGVLYGGDLGATVADYMRRAGGIITLDDLARYETIERSPVHGRYRGFEIAGAPPPTAGGLHLVEMLNILEGFDPRGLRLRHRGVLPPDRRGAQDRLRGPQCLHRRSGLRGHPGRAAHLEGVRGRAARADPSGSGGRLRRRLRTSPRAPPTPRTSPPRTPTATWSR